VGSERWVTFSAAKAALLFSAEQLFHLGFLNSVYGLIDTPIANLLAALLIRLVGGVFQEWFFKRVWFRLPFFLARLYYPPAYPSLTYPPPGLWHSDPREACGST